MTDRPILFGGTMVRALLAGTKTQMRRLTTSLPTQRIQLGDRLWVREQWHAPQAYDDLSPSQMGGEEGVFYQADGKFVRWQSEFAPVLCGRPRASIHMPRWASRITLIVTDKRTEWLQGISEEDARAEGAIFHDGRQIGHSGWRHDPTDGYVFANARSSFVRLWGRLHDKPGRRCFFNPIVIALTFEVKDRNIDQ